MIVGMLESCCNVGKLERWNVGMCSDSYQDVLSFISGIMVDATQ
jgi:hypothetical protein